MVKSIQFNFAVSPKGEYRSIVQEEQDSIPRYDDVKGYGFVDKTCAQPPREVHVEQIVPSQEGYTISEARFVNREEAGENDFNHFGLCFRVKAGPGAYRVQVRTTSSLEGTRIAISGMNADELLNVDYWDAARLVPNRTRVFQEQNVWSYDYVNGREYIDIEIEPRRLQSPVGIAELVLTPIPIYLRPESKRPTLFTLGDSTVKSYIFMEAPMSGWGQVFDDLFDSRQVSVINYAMGGRSFKSAYTEGRFNDILLTGYAGDVVLIQFGHNDESHDEDHRFGRGATEEMYRTYIREFYIPAIRSRQMIPMLVTPMARVDGEAPPGHVYTDSFRVRKFPVIMRELAEELNVPLIDLNRESLRYYNEIGIEGTTAVFMSIEAGETPAKTNDGSFANGHPACKIDGTHFKESLSKPFARIVATCLVQLGEQGELDVARVASWLKPEVQAAIREQDWSAIYPEKAADTMTGRGAYYRNQIEKLVQLGILGLDEQSFFHPEAIMSVGEFRLALSRLLNLDPDEIKQNLAEGTLSRELMGSMLQDAFDAKFSMDALPAYMTDYNGEAIIPELPEYDPHLAPDQRGLMYYPLVSFEQLQDTVDIDPVLYNKVKKAYTLGLLRSEKGIERGQVRNGYELEPKAWVTREKAAKSLYYMWVLYHPIEVENDLSVLKAGSVHPVE
ncbi:GDSL-type esterase/lipase family protein [Paenibacillus amylolyticus]|uniref:SGNH hydrolase-type esterase domain-containing protein n=1 Tax=Paenibacillus amylolyticus TaxID=1451 RepID=A0A100VLW0_PAEAM|nr:GDSL-type esterase/lipase family protein [Paenibacillus amylolyticus]GAS82139.1 unknown protein [Paenibacillus amylolyticus]